MRIILNPEFPPEWHGTKHQNDQNASLLVSIRKTRLTSQDRQWNTLQYARQQDRQ